LNKNNLNNQGQEFINSQLKQKITKNILSGSPFAEVAIPENSHQNATQKKYRSKLPVWFTNANN